jgi:hypothetical protein
MSLCLKCLETHLGHGIGAERAMTLHTKTESYSATPTPLHLQNDLERGHVWSPAQSPKHLTWQRPYATGTPLPGSPERQTSLDDNQTRQHTLDIDPSKLLLTLKQRVRHFVWTWFTMTMATGQLANVILVGVYPTLHRQVLFASSKD